VPLRLPDTWIWDFWLARDGEDYHVFYLQAPRSLGDPELRHFNASIGHAVSRDLREWSPLPDALRLGPPSAWDGHAVWTGCDPARQPLAHVLHRRTRRRRRFDRTTRGPRDLDRPGELAQVPGQPTHRGRPTLLQPARPRYPGTRASVARPVGLPAPAERRIPRPHNGQRRRRPLRWSRRRSPRALGRPRVLGDPAAAHGAG
jgi:hypothetical protein